MSADTLRSPESQRTVEEKDGVLPLPVVIFEEYMLADDQTAYPMTFFSASELTGEVDRAAMSAAFTEALTRHPMLNARVVRRGLRSFWETCNQTPELEWYDHESAPELPVGCPVDVRNGPAVRAYAVHGHDECQLVISFHHAATDGVGAMQFLGDVLAIYGRATTTEGRAPTLPDVDPAGLRLRNTFDISTPHPVSGWEVAKSLMQETWKMVVRRPQPILNRNRPDVASRQRSCMPIGRLDPERSLGLNQLATSKGVVANDVMLRDMLLTIRNWNQQQSPGLRGWLRINLPTTLRGKRDTDTPAANILGYAFITKRISDCDDPEKLLQDLARETALIKAWGFGALFVEALRYVGKVPGLLPAATWISRRFATLVFSNIGDPSRRFRNRFRRKNGELVVGNLVLKNVVAAPPIRPGTRIAVLLWRYAGRQYFSVHADPRWLSREDSECFRDLYESQLNLSAACELAKRSDRDAKSSQDESP